tara:strand:- start:14405 stop:14686 length:282 start_codon:yes stop_codon:yes gene_type:complete
MGVDATMMLSDILVDLLNLRKLGDFSPADHQSMVVTYLKECDLPLLIAPYARKQGTEPPYLHNPEPFIQEVYERLLMFHGCTTEYMVREGGQF